jgi:hypothetical protein
MASPKTPKTEFRAKTWIYLARLILFGFFCVFGLTMGPFLLTVATNRPNNQHLKKAGLGITTVTACIFLPATVLAGFNVWARRLPLLRIRRDGIEVHVIGLTTLDGVPGVPGLVRFAWGVLTTQSFRSRILRARWAEIQGARVSGLPAMRVLTFDATFWARPGTSSHAVAPVGHQVVFAQVDFKRPLQDVANAIAFYARNPATRAELPSWS